MNATLEAAADISFEAMSVKMQQVGEIIIKDPGADNSNSPGLLLEPSDNPIASNYMNALHESGLAAITFGVPDVQAEYERLLAAGVTFQGEPSEDPSGVSAVFDDGCGNFIQLHQD